MAMELKTTGVNGFVKPAELTNMETLRLPSNGTYTEERRGDKDMFFDIDWKTNALNLYNFIYE